MKKDTSSLLFFFLFFSFLFLSLISVMQSRGANLDVFHSKCTCILLAATLNVVHACSTHDLQLSYSSYKNIVLCVATTEVYPGQLSIKLLECDSIVWIHFH